MKKTLIIGSTALDVIINVPELPKTSEDVNILNQSMALGGCAFNVMQMIRLFKIPHLFCSPVGTGIYGNYVANELHKIGINPFIRIPDQDNGCCYCYVEPHGERTFLSYHGAEYIFREKWLDSYDLGDYDSVYICGLELEEPTGIDILSFLDKHSSKDIYFAPGPRFSLIDPSRLKTLFSFSPILHLNREEICTYTGEDTLEDAAKELHTQTNNAIIITDGDNGAYIYESSVMVHAPAFSTKVVDTIGAGDAHIGAIIACRKLGYSYSESLRQANLISSKVAATKGASLSEDDFSKSRLILDQ